MIDSKSCTYKTPCGWCSVQNKKCQEEHKNNVPNELKNLNQRLLCEYGIKLIDDNNNFRPANEVLIDICKALNNIWNVCENNKQYAIRKESLFELLVGKRYSGVL